MNIIKFTDKNCIKNPNIEQDVENPDRQDYIYFASNRYMPGLIKIGYTSRNINERLLELSKQTGVPGNFECVGFITIHSGIKGQGIETLLHRRLKKYHETKEFYKIDLNKLKYISSKIVDGIIIEDRESVEKKNKKIIIIDLYKRFFSNIEAKNCPHASRKITNDFCQEYGIYEYYNTSIDSLKELKYARENNTKIAFKEAYRKQKYK